MIVVDTNVVSYIFNRNALAEFYAEKIGQEQAVLSFQTLEEIWFGAFRNEWGEGRVRRLARHLQQYEIIWPNGRILRLSAQLRVEREKVGRALAPADAWIAATALWLRCRLATHDRDFSGIPGLDLIQAGNP